jgi:hypothetical protein
MADRKPSSASRAHAPGRARIHRHPQPTCCSPRSVSQSAARERGWRGGPPEVLPETRKVDYSC